VEKAASLDAERQAKAELQLRLDEIEEGTAEMEKLLEENEVRSHPIGRSIAIKHKRARPHSTDWLWCAVSCCVVLCRAVSCCGSSAGPRRAKQGLPQPNPSHAFLRVCVREPSGATLRTLRPGHCPAQVSERSQSAEH
jgi:hypothetical protein